MPWAQLGALGAPGEQPLCLKLEYVKKLVGPYFMRFPIQVEVRQYFKKCTNVLKSFIKHLCVPSALPGAGDTRGFSFTFGGC